MSHEPAAQAVIHMVALRLGKYGMRYHEIIEATVAPRSPKSSTGTKPPLTPEQSRREAERRTRVQKQMRDEQQRHSAKVTDLRDRLSRTP